MRYTAMYYDGAGKLRSAGTYDEELEALAAARREQGKRPGGATGSMTLAEKRAVTFERFWPIFQRHHRVEPNTMQDYYGHFHNWIRPRIGTARIATFGPVDAINLFTALAEDGATVNTRKACRNVISSMINLAMKMEYRSNNPVRGLSVGKQPANKSIKVINEAVFWELSSHLRLPAQKLFAEFIISTGVRFCEAISFAEGDLDYCTGMLMVCRSTVELSRQFHPTGGRFYTRPYTKNGEHRRFKIGRPLVEKIRAHVEGHQIKPGDLIFPVRLFYPDDAWVNLSRCTEEEMVAARKTKFVSPVTGNLVSHGTVSSYVKHKCQCGPCTQKYCDSRSEQRVRTKARQGKVVRRRIRRDGNDFLSPTEWSRAWIPARRAVGVDVTPYQLRHSHASLLLAHGVPLPDVQARLGHRDLTSTTHYVWALSEESEAAANAMNVLLGYEQKSADPQEAMLAKMETLMQRMEAMMEPDLIRRMAAEQGSGRPDLHLVSDTLDAMQIRADQSIR